MTAQGTYQARTADQHRAAAQRWWSKAERESRRNPAKAWDYEMNARASELRAELAITGGRQRLMLSQDGQGNFFLVTEAEVAHLERQGKSLTVPGWTMRMVEVPVEVVFDGHDPMTSRPGVGHVVTRPTKDALDALEKIRIVG